MAPTDLSCSTLSYPPPLATGTTVCTLSTTDENCCQTFSYSITGGANAASFSIVGSQLRANVAGGLSGNNLAVTITTNDGNGGTFSKTLTISECESSLVGVAIACAHSSSLALVVPTANVSPTNMALSANTYVPPTASANVVVGTLSSTDANTGETFSYSVVGGTHQSLFGITGTQLVLLNAGQTGTNFQVTVRTTDSRGGTFDKTFTVNDGG